MKRLTLIILLLMLPLVCFAQDATTRATPKCDKYQEDKEGPVYAIIEIKVLDKETYARYLEEVGPIIEKYNGRYIVRTDKINSISGDWSPDRIVIIKFFSLADLENCFNSPEYKKIQPLRESSAQGSMVVVEEFGE